MKHTLVTICSLTLFSLSLSHAQERARPKVEAEAEAPAMKRFGLYVQYTRRDLSDTKTARELRDRTGAVLPTSLVFDQFLFSASFRVTPEFSLEYGTSYLQSDINLKGRIPSRTGAGLVDFDRDSGSSGFTDMRLGARWLFYRSGRHSLDFAQHASFPTGSVTEQDGPTILPYSGQLGSGTNDFISSLGYQYLSGGGIRVNADLNYTLRTGRSELNYRMGNQFVANLLVGYEFRRIVGAYVKARLRDWQNSDDPRYASGALPLNDPYIIGGTRWETLLVGRAGVPLPGYVGALTLEAGIPFYQDQSAGDVQLETDWYLNTAIAFAL